jgi:hypothetical protein
MKRTFLLGLTLLYNIICYAQQKLPQYMSHDTSLYKYPPLLIVKTEAKEIKLRMTQIDQLNSDQIDSVVILKDNNAIKTYGAAARFGVVLIKMKKDVIINDTAKINLSINSLTINNKSLKSYNLPIYIDSLYVNHPEDVNRSIIKIKSIGISTELLTGIKFINILTDHSQYKTYLNKENGSSRSTSGIIIYLRGNGNIN